MDTGQDFDGFTGIHRDFKELFAEGKVDAFLGAPPKSQELRARKVGRVILNSVTDRPRATAPRRHTAVRCRMPGIR